jgi:hypothetical protein
MISICEFPTNPSRHRTKARDSVRASGGAVSAAAAVMLTLLGSGCGGVDGNDSADPDVQLVRSALGSTEPLQTITTLAQLRAMTVTGNYRLGNNIDASPTAQAGQQFVPIGSPFNAFRGTFDGNGKTINNLRINTNGSWYTGLFSGASGAIIKNVGLTNVNVSGGGFTGAIAGLIGNSQVTSSYVTGTVSGPSSGSVVQAIGMALGSAGASTEVNRCYATGTVTGLTLSAGGFVGEINGGSDFSNAAKFTEIFTNVNVTPTTQGVTYDVAAGGLVGVVQGAWIEDINSHGNVTGRGVVGGIAGEVFNDSPNYVATVLDDCVSNGVVTDARTPQRAGTYGYAHGFFAHCTTIWNSTTDTGSPQQSGCQPGMSRDALRAPHPSPNRLVNPFIRGELITQDKIPPFQQWQLGLGSDGDWGFGYVPDTVTVWALNSSTEYITLTRIPNPSVQPR